MPRQLLSYTPVTIRKILSSALIDMGNAARDIGSRLGSSAPPDESPANRLARGRAVHESAVLDVLNACSTGTDHFQAFARLVRMEEEFGPVIATVARGTVEAFGRGWWLASAGTPELLEFRRAAMHRDEIRMALSKGIQVADDGGILSAEEAMRREDERLKTVQIDGLSSKVPGFAELAITVMTAADVDRPVALYSHLSGAAHGQHFTAGGFVTPTDDDPTIGKFHLPFHFLNDYAWATTHVLDIYMTELIRLWAASNELERWEQVRVRVYQTFDQVGHLVRDELERRATEAARTAAT